MISIIVDSSGGPLRLWPQAPAREGP